MKLWPFSLMQKPVMQEKNFFEELAEHLTAQAMGDGDLPDTLQGFGSQRDRFIRFSPLYRAVTIISSLSAQMLCNGGLSIRDGDDNKVKNRRADRILELLTHSPDGGITPSLNFIEDVMVDYLLDGNGLVQPFTSAPMMPIGLVRYRPYGAYTVDDGGPVYYQAQRAVSNDGTLYNVPARDMIHVRWPLLFRGYVASHQRMYFSPAPINLFSRQIMTGMIQDAYLYGRFDKASLASVLINYEAAATGRAAPTPEQVKQIGLTLADMVKKSAVIVGYGARGSEVASSPVHEHALAARAQLVEEIARMYGLPLPLLSAPIGQWTRGTNEQVMKMAWRTGVRSHLDRLLSAFKTRLLLPGERFEVDPSEFVRGDAQGIAEMVMAMQGDAQRDPIASRAELRHTAGLPRQPDGDIVATRQEKTPMGEPNGET